MFLQVTKPVSSFLKKQGSLGFGQDRIVHPPLGGVSSGERSIWIRTGVLTEQGFSLVVQENVLVIFLP